MSALDFLFSPRSIAVIGVSTKADKLGHIVLRNLRDGGYAGAVYAVNPKGGRILDTPTYTEVGGIPEPVDLAVVAVPATAVVEVAEQCGRHGVKALVVIAAGFREIGGEGSAREVELQNVIEKYGMRLLGPNCLGLIDTHSKINASFAGAMPPAGGLAVLSQSGAMGTAILDWAVGSGTGFSKFVSLGNEADLTEADFLSVLEADPRTDTVLAYLEEIVDGTVFTEAAGRLSRVKPLLLLKPGRTDAGARAAASHTGALTGSSEAAEAAFRRAGVVHARTIQELFDYAQTFSRVSTLSRRANESVRVAVVTNAGGPGVVTADAIGDATNLTLANLSDRTQSTLRKILPGEAQVGNPVDVIGDARANRYQVALSGVLADRGVDAVVVLLTPQAMTEVLPTAEVIVRAARNAGKPVLPVFIGGHAVAPGFTRTASRGLPTFSTPDRAIIALDAVAGYAAYCAQPIRHRQRPGKPQRKTAELLKQVAADGRTELGGLDAAAVVKPYGIETPLTIRATETDDAVAAAAKVGYPVALKIDSPDILHKTDVGGVQLDLANAEAVERAFTEIMQSVSRKAKGADVRGVTVSPMLPAEGIDLLIGATRDPSFGPVLTVGQGGIFVEGIGDVSYELAPLSAADATNLLDRTRIGKLLDGARGSSFDKQAAVKAILAISQLMLDNPQVSELELNPFRAFPKGGWALDIRMVLS